MILHYRKRNLLSLWPHQPLREQSMLPAVGRALCMINIRGCMPRQARRVGRVTAELHVYGKPPLQESTAEHHRRRPSNSPLNYSRIKHNFG